MDPWAAKIWAKQLQDYSGIGKLAPDDYKLLKNFLEMAETAWSEHGVTAEKYLETRPDIAKPYAKLLGLDVKPPPRTPERSGPPGSLMAGTGRSPNIPTASPSIQVKKNEDRSLVIRTKSPAASHIYGISGSRPNPGSLMPDPKPVPNANATGSKELPPALDKAGQPHVSGTSSTPAGLRTGKPFLPRREPIQGTRTASEGRRKETQCDIPAQAFRSVKHQNPQVSRQGRPQALKPAMPVSQGRTRPYAPVLADPNRFAPSQAAPPSFVNKLARVTSKAFRTLGKRR